MTGLPRISLKTVAQFLDYKSVRSAEKWCDINDIYVFCEGGRKFVFFPQFESKLDAPLLNKLKEKYPKTYTEIYDALNRRDIEKFNELTSLTKRYTQTYVPKSEAAKKFFN
jgi:hypothetical protein